MRSLLLSTLLLLAGAAIAGGANPPKTYTLTNGSITAKWKVDGDQLVPVSLTDSATNTTTSWTQSLFELSADRAGRAGGFGKPRLSGNPRIEALAGDVKAPRFSDRLPGKRLVASFTLQGGVQAIWSATLRVGSRYLRQEVVLKAVGKDVALGRVGMSWSSGSTWKAVGDVPGSPLVSKNCFAGVEHPMASNSVNGSQARAWLERALPLKKGQTFTLSGVFGFFDEGQTRRAFLTYVDRERARPYAPFLHYNSWYDIGYFTPYNETECLDVIHQYATELVQKRGVKMDSFLFDDGWDDTSTVWQFHKGFPNGFLPLKQAAAEIGAAPGIWLSPWGGYGDPRKRRLATGKAAGMEIDTEGYALSGPNYYKRFHETVLDLVGKYGINQFKLDGTGSPNKQYPGSAFGSDFEAAIQLIQDLRAAKPGLFINLTTGTWPSPFWTRYADSIWRGGEDHSFAGVGTNRERWITYRDGDTYQGVHLRGPLYPLNSLMLHGIIYAKHAHNLNTDPQNDFRNEVHDYFGTGTQLQEMYVTPSLLSQQNWDDLAESAKWSRANADVLWDTHWIGGDPQKLEVYGWAAWNPRKATLVLRNPSDEPQTFVVEAQAVFELPKGAARRFSLHSPWASDKDKPAMPLVAGQPLKITLQPFQVLTYDATPVR